MQECGGSADVVANILLRRIKNNAKQAKPDWDSFEHDFKHLLNQLTLENNDAPRTAIMRQTIIAHPTFAMAMVDVLSILVDKTSQPTDARLANALLYPLIAIRKHFSLKGYDSVAQLVRTNVITLITRLTHSYGSHDDIVDVSGCMLDIFANFAIYRPFLNRTGRNLMASSADYPTAGRGGEVCQDIIVLTSLVNQYADILKAKTQYAFCCGSPEVRLAACNLFT
ncbi:hypothetical protein FIBSPDRAFT_533566 [Athelia psychrophila]|uniref:Uncharacterized protein n=1 Tax=Athelia psychrophila TaxID=1759441 RepID=A0A166JB57_9AGAM|nr:hypothetical protein FIBSPDRAFT_533566 [Fibularhizoctonia sp. CBS 109695]